jgi:geranyl-CoA carboxylase alpha subunit
MSFTKVLIANRGEIACRVMRTAHRMGYRTVAVYSDADAGAPHVDLAHEAVAIGPAPVTQSYLDVERVLDAARRSRADAIHPGYGFLSENADFARACEGAGITFIGPPATAVDLMGNKRAAKLRMIDAGVPTVPGYSGEDQSVPALVREAERVGFPLMVKAAAGGGGRGMRLVWRSDELPEALRAARSESENAFGSGELILERALLRPRHVEVQVFGDRHGNVVHLGERDCSVQRRHQKVIEESPSPAVSPSLREKLGAAAVEAARAVGYIGAGTVEFLLDSTGAFYFLEMNTRLQVEHPITEMVTGLDLVERQLRVARGEPLPLEQHAVALSGHAIEARLYAEDPSNGFVPQTGRLLRYELPEGHAVRIDAGVRAGSMVGPHYDPMLAKVIIHAGSREDAARQLSAALRELCVLGVVTNKEFLAAICEHPAFVRGEVTTAFLGEEFAGSPTLVPVPPTNLQTACASLCAYFAVTAPRVEDESFIGWHSGGPIWTTVVLSSSGREASVRITAEGRGGSGRRYVVMWNEDEAEPPHLELEVCHRDGRSLVVLVSGVRHRVRHAREGDRIWVDDGSRTLSFENVTHRPVASESDVGTGRITAPLDGAVRKLFASEGTPVARGEPLLVLEAMKMEHPIKADVHGVVSRIHVREGTQVKTRQLLVEIEALPVEA